MSFAWGDGDEDAVAIHHRSPESEMTDLNTNLGRTKQRTAPETEVRQETFLQCAQVLCKHQLTEVPIDFPALAPVGVISGIKFFQ